jgi:hypothetical protein
MQTSFVVAEYWTEEPRSFEHNHRLPFFGALVNPVLWFLRAQFPHVFLSGERAKLHRARPKLSSSR